MENQEDYPTDRPEAPKPSPTLFSLLGWRAGRQLTANLEENLRISGMNLIWEPFELTFLLGNLKTAEGRFPGSLTVADRAATNAWHRISYLVAPLSPDEYTAPLTEDRPTCVGVGIATQMMSPHHKCTEFSFVFRSDLERIGIRLVLAPNLLDLRDIDRIGCGLLHQAMLLYPNLPSFDPLPEGVVALTRHLPFRQDTS